MLDLYLITLRELLANPRNVVDSFLAKSALGKYMHPFTFCLTGGIFVIIMNTLFVDFSFAPGPVEAENEQIEQMMQWIQVANVRAATQFLPLSMILFFIMTLSLAGLFFFREQLQGFYSNLILNSYSMGAAQLPLLLLIPVWMWFDLPLTHPFMNSTLPAILVAGTILWVYIRYFRSSSFMNWLKLLSSFITGYVLFVIINGFAAGVVGYLIYAVKRIIELAG